jgi:hypothetical protein
MKKISEIILSTTIPTATRIYDDKLCQVLDEMAEDIKALKTITMNEHPWLAPDTFKEREYEK